MGEFVLMNKEAIYARGGQAGIHYRKVRDQKLYHIKSYTTDTVRLSMSHPATFSIYGGASKKEVEKKFATVSSGGRVTCHRHGKDEKLYTIVKAVSKMTGETKYIYIYFQKKIAVKTGKTLYIYEKHRKQLAFNYAYGRIVFSASSKKIQVDGRGRVEARKPGTAYVTAKVQGSRHNELRVRVVVQKEPWIVSNTNTRYDYADMTRDLHGLVRKYPGKTGLESIGKTWDGREIWCLRLGSGKARRRLVIDAAIHGREWKNTQVIMRQAEEMLRDYKQHEKRFAETSLYILPMDNPDGVSIAQYGFAAIRDKKLRKLCEKIGHAKVWKANARGVNINNNFPAGFKKQKKKQKPHYKKYFGKKAGSEKETRALIEFIERTKPRAVLNLHSMGNVLYWDFNVGGKLHDELREFANKISSFNKYTLMPKGRSTRATGGFCDWLVCSRQIASVTVETGSVPCPLPHSQFSTIYKKNNKMFQWFMTEY